MQQVASRLARSFIRSGGMGKPSPLLMLKSPLSSIPAENLHHLLPSCREDQAVLIHPSEDSESSVFYFPGCGSERLFSGIAMASVYLLLKVKRRIVIPPPSICCGFPAKANAKTANHNRISLRNSIIFAQIRKMFGYLDFEACLVSCGTCMEGLQELDMDRTFGAPIEDINRFVLRNGLSVTDGDTCLYHAPCHDTLKGQGIEVLSRYTPITSHAVPHCCSEAGTMALSRPDIANALRERKGDAMMEAQGLHPESRKILTNCPSCIQGLGRNRTKQMQPVHIAEDLAARVGGKQWRRELAEMLKTSEAITF